MRTRPAQQSEGRYPDSPRSRPAGVMWFPVSVQVSSVSIGGSEFGDAGTSSIVLALVVIAASSSIEASQEVAAVAGFPSVELPGQDRPSEAERGGGFRENTDHIGAASDSFVDPLERICGPDVTPVAL